MNRGIALLVAVVVVAGIVAVAPVGIAAAQDDPGETNETSAANETADISPGERFSGVIGVQNAEISGEVESRAFEVGLNATETDAERAAFVDEQLTRSEQRLAEIEQRQRELREQREAGELSQGAFAARMAETSARAERIKRETNRSAEVARGIPERVRTEQGIDEERLATLRDRAGNATGPKVAAIAREVAGDDVGGPLAPETRGPRSDLPGSSPDRPGSGNGPADGDRSGNATNATDGSNGGESPDMGGTIDAGEANVTDGTDDAADRDENRSSSAVKGALGDLSSAVDAVGDRLAETITGGSSGSA